MNIIKEGAFMLESILSPAECQELISKGEMIGFEAASVVLKAGAKMMPEVRNNDRVIFDDEELARLLWERVKVYIPEQIDDAKPTRLNPRFRIYRYIPGQRFKGHKDGVETTPQGDSSRYTVLVYLNDSCKGGETVFIERKRTEETLQTFTQSVTPRVGMSLIFLHQLMHEGAEVKEGEKYVLRTDVLYPTPYPKS
jgi:prolyl 4-hydroxylase